MAHPYMANSTPQAQREMLDAIGAGSVEELFRQIPAGHRMASALRLPPALSSEVALERHLRELLSKNTNCEQALNFLGAGCWQHYVPAACQEIVRRREWLTSVFGSPMSDHGRNQAWFEFCSQLAELIGMEFVGLPVYSWGCAAGHAIRMASRINGRRQVLVVEALDPERLAVIRNYCESPEMASHLTMLPIRYEAATGRADLADLSRKISRDTAAVYFEVPSYLGVIDDQASRIAALARAHGAETIVGVDPISLGVLAAPAEYGADIVVGPTAAARRADELRRRRRRVHRRAAIRFAMPANIPRSWSASPIRPGRESAGSASVWYTRPRMECARKARTGLAIPRICGRSPVPPTWR